MIAVFKTQLTTQLCGVRDTKHFFKYSHHTWGGLQLKLIKYNAVS